jgi:hypothetical protein
MNIVLKIEGLDKIRKTHKEKMNEIFRNVIIGYSNKVLEESKEKYRQYLAASQMRELRRIALSGVFHDHNK